MKYKLTEVNQSKNINLKQSYIHVNRKESGIMSTTHKMEEEESDKISLRVYTQVNI